VLGLIRAAKGEIRFFNKSLNQSRKQIAYVPQRASVDWDFPATVADTVLMGTYGKLGWLRRPNRDSHNQALQAMAQVGISDLARQPLRELSGGQQQRVFLARALAQDAQLYILDEPFQGVDALTERAIADILQQLVSAGKTVIAVHHDLQTVRDYFDWVILLNRSVIAQGPTVEAFTAENARQAYGPALRWFL
jgi:manganese/zinc/iron transport system ATP- binding protein